MQESTKPKINRRRFVGSVGLLGTLTTIKPFSIFAGPKSSINDEGGLMKCKPYLQAATTNSIIVRWITKLPAHSWVEYGETADNLNFRARQIKDGMVQVSNTVHAIAVQGLRPGRTYHYRVVSEIVKSFKRKEIAFGPRVSSETFSFSTLSQDKDEVDFLIFNDVHERPETFSHLMQFADKTKKDFVLLNGDMYNSLRDEDHLIRDLLAPLSDLFATQTPFFFARGNHETAGALSSRITDYFDGNQHTFYYSLPYGPMWGIVLDSGETKSDQDPKNGGIIEFDSYRIAQAKWLEREVQKEEFKKAKFKVVFIHIPPNLYLGEPKHAPTQYEEIWGSIFNEAKIDLMICGHTHRHGVHPPVPGKHNYPIVIGGGKRDGGRTIINIKANQQSLKLRMTDDGGKLVGELDL